MQILYNTYKNVCQHIFEIIFLNIISEIISFVLFDKQMTLLYTHIYDKVEFQAERIRHELKTNGVRRSALWRGV